MEIRLLGETNKKYLEEQTKIVATAAKLSRYEGNVLEIYDNLTDNYESNLKFIKRVMKMGHDSITDHDFVVFALKDVSAIVEQTIIKQRFASFTIKSRREVDFSQAGYYVPNFHNDKNELLENNQSLQLLYKKYMDNLFQEYNKLVQMEIPVEDARYILPYCFHSNIIMGVDTHSLKDLIIELTKGKSSNITELKELGERLYDIMITRCPYLKDVIDDSKQINADPTEKYLDSILSPYRIPEPEHLENPILLSATPNLDDVLFISAIMRIYGYTYEESRGLYQKYIENNSEIKEKLIRHINHFPEELKNIHFNFQIPISLANLTHLTRHRTVQLSIPDFVPIKNLDTLKVPQTILKANYNIADITKKNQAIYELFKSMHVREEDLIYFYLSGNIFQVIANMDGKTLAHILKLRCCNKAQWEIRSVANEIRNLVADHSIYYSQILGPTCEVESVCHEGKECCGKIKKLKPKKISD